MAKKRKKKMEFSKRLLIADYIILGVLILCAVLWGEFIDFTTVITVWVAQIGLSSAAYYWKAKTENRTKIPLKVVASLPPEIRAELDMTQVITSIIQSE